MALPRLLKPFLDSGVFTKADAERAVGKGRAENGVKYLRKTGYVHVVRKGLYALDAERTGVVPDKYVLASKIQPEGVLSYHTALELLGVAHSAFYDTLYVSAKKRVRPFTYAHLEYRTVPAPEAWLAPAMQRKVKRAGETLRAAAPELALVQCVDRLHYAGGLDEVVHSVEGFRSLDWGKVEALVAALGASGGERRAYGQAALASKVGFLAERYASRWHTPPQFLDAMRARVGKGATYFGTTRKQGSRWVAAWRLAVPRTFRAREEHG